MTAILTGEETAVLNGNYKYEIVLQTANGERKSLAYGIAIITASMLNEILMEKFKEFIDSPRQNNI